jgi:hypothetical protein
LGEKNERNKKKKLLDSCCLCVKEEREKKEKETLVGFNLAIGLGCTVQR